jgi:flagellar assembly protein FliH
VQTAHIIDAHGYTVGAQPFQVAQVELAALKELQRKRAAGLASTTPASGASEGSAQAFGPPVADAVALQLREEAEDLKQQAGRLLKGAMAKAKTLQDEAETEAAQIKAKAKEEGYQEGFSRGTEDGYEEGEKKGEESGLAKHAEATSRFEALFTAALAEKEAYFTDREALLVELATRIAAKVIGREVDTRPDHITHMLRQAVRRLSDRSKLVVSLHPDDLEKVTQARADGALSFSGVKQIEFLADDKMIQGGLRIQSAGQTLDASLDSQLSEIVRGLLEEAYHET